MHPEDELLRCHLATVKFRKLADAAAPVASLIRRDVNPIKQGPGETAMGKALVSVVFVLASVFVSTVCCAQTGSATVSGRVSDPSGAAIVGAQVVLTNTDTRVDQRTTTNSEGFYVFSGIRPGKYRVAASSAGFRTLIKENLILHVQDELAENFLLNLGSVNESVTVDSTAPLVNTSDASVSTVIDRQFVENMPLNGRSFQSLIELTPGVVATGGSNGLFNGTLSVHGQREDSNSFILDGVSANVGVTATPGSAFTIAGSGASGSLPNLTALGTTQSLVSVDAMQEFRVQTSTYSAEYGRQPGGQVSIATRSGTNNFHGTAFDYLRNTVLDANDWFANANAQPRAPMIQNDFGGVFGGPVRIPHLYNGKDRTFFFFSYEGLRLKQPTFSLSNVPTVATRQSAVPSLQPVMNAFPVPNCPAGVTACSTDLGNGLGDFVASYSNPSSIDATSIRIDHIFNEKWTTFGRFNDSPSYAAARGLFNLSIIGGNFVNTKTTTLGLTGVLSPRLTNDLRFNYSAANAYQTYVGDSFGGAAPLAASYLIPSSISVASAQSSISLGTFTGLTNTGGVSWDETNGPLTVNETMFNIVDTVSYLVGAHQLKFGVDWRRVTPTAAENQYLVSANFTNASQLATGVAPTGGLRAQGNPQPLYNNYSLFAQDHWRVGPRFSLDLGVRWDVNPSPSSLNGLLPPAVNQVTDFATMALASAGTPLWQTTYNNFAPRLGAAYQISDKPGHELVLRTGFGMFYDTGNNLGSTAYNSYPFNIVTTIKNIRFPLTPSEIAPPVIPALNNLTPPYGTLFLYAPDLKLPYTLEYSVALEHQIGAGQAVTVSYVGASGQRLLQNQQYSLAKINPNFTTIDLTTNNSTSSYNSLEAQYRRRLSHGLQALFSYTWSHAIDDASNDVASAFPPIRGNSAFDVPHVFAGALTYDIPEPWQEGFARAVLGGWGVDTNIHAQSGLPYNVIASQAMNLATGGTTIYFPNAVPGQPLYISGAAANCPYANGICPGGKRANPAAFVAPPSGQNGNFGRDILRAASDWQIDMAIRRQFKISEKLRFQFRTDAFNVFNHPSFSSYNATLGSSNFGLPTKMLNNALPGINPLYQIGGPRSLQISGKLTF